MISMGLLDELTDRRLISSRDVERLRRAVYEDGVMERDEAEALFRLNRDCLWKDPSWHEFFIDELTYYFVHRAEPRGYVSEENAEFLTLQVLRGGRIAGANELELLVNIIDAAQSCPRELVLFVLDAVRESVLSPETAAYGAGRTPRRIEPIDVALIRKVIYGGGGGGAYTVTRREADLLFDLHDATVGAENAEDWSDLFVKGVASHLMWPLEPPAVPEADDVLKHREWLERRRSLGRFLREVGQALAKFEVAEAWREVDPFGTRREREADREQETWARVELERASVGPAEAVWLIGRVGLGGHWDDDVCSLLAFIRAHAPRVDGALDPLFERAGI